MNIKIQKTDKNAKIPTRGSASAAGYDLYANEDMVIPWLESRKIGTGIKVEIPEGYFGAIFARSGLASKRGLRPANCVGVIDSDYRGEIIVALHNDTMNLPDIISHDTIEFTNIEEIHSGDRIAQLVILPYLQVEFEEVESLSDTARGDGGFGSTDPNMIDGQVKMSGF